MSRRRSRYDLYADVLDAVRRHGPCTITMISYSARLPVDRAKRIVERLESKGFVSSEQIRGRKHYVLAAQGAEFLELYKRLRAMLAALEE